ncbi:hypothetical protein KJ865_06600, partial [Myxococcota bacterium]|nr:hypothetical protein [Myxococcota bacterium]
AVCSYVGDLGVARFTMTKARGGISKEEILNFSDAEALKTTTTNHFTNGVYQNTTYYYEWQDPNGHTIFLINGSHRSRNGPPKLLTDNYYFADGARFSWNLFKLSDMLTTIDAGGMVEFPTSDFTMAVGKNSFNIIHPKKQLVWTLDDIDEVSLHEGFITLKSVKFAESGFFSRFLGKGKLTFPYSSVPNGELLLMLIEHFTGKNVIPGR